MADAACRQELAQLTTPTQVKRSLPLLGQGARWRAYGPATLLIAPLLIFLLGFYVIPMTSMLAQSFSWWSGDAEADGSATLYQYAKTLNSSRAMGAIERTFRISLFSVVFCILLSYPIALWLVTARRFVRTLVLVITFVSLAASLIVRNYGWLIVLSNTGPVNGLLVALGIVEFPLQLTYNESAIIVALVHYGMPFMILPIYGSLLRIPPALWEASFSLGAGTARTLWCIVFPLSVPGIFGGTILVFAVSMSAFVTPLMLGSPSTAMASQVAAEQMLVQLNFAWGSAIIITLTVATLLLVWAYALLIRRMFRVNV